jgi:hypothetical protein
MQYVYVKDSEGYVSKKLKSDVCKGEKNISEKAYLKASGLAYYEKTFRHGGARENAGQKPKFFQPLKIQMRVTKEEKDFISYAREHGLILANLMKI